jgi:hypothetical protein
MYTTGNLGILETCMTEPTNPHYIGMKASEITCVFSENAALSGGYIDCDTISFSNTSDFSISVLILSDDKINYSIRSYNTRSPMKTFRKVLIHIRFFENDVYHSLVRQDICWIEEDDLRLFRWINGGSKSALK